LRLILKVPPDASLLSSTLYEGVAYLLSVAGGKVTPEYIELPDDAFTQAFSRVARDKETLGRLRIATALNDYKSINNLLKSLGINAEDFWPEKKKGGKAKIVSYGHLITRIAEAATSKPELLNRSETVELGVRLKGRKEIIIGSEEPFLSLALFKSCDKYGSLRVWEYTSLSDQVPQRLSINAALTCLLGLYSSYVWRVGNTNIFLFLDPSEIAESLNAPAADEDPSEAMQWRINARNVGKEVIREFIEAAVVPPAILARLALSVKFAEALGGTNIEVLRLRLVRVDEEGRIYKVYGDTPIEARKQPYLKEALSEELSKHVDASSPLMTCIRLFVQKSQGIGRALCEENDHVLRAIDALYRFVALEDPVALAEYARHLRDAADVLEAAVKGGGSGKSAWRMRTYRWWVARLDRAVRELAEDILVGYGWGG